MRKLYIPVVDLIRPAIAGLIGVALVAALLGHQLGVQHPGVSAAETATVQTVQAKTLGAQDMLVENSLYLPHKVGLYALEKLDITSVRAIRAVGAIMGLIGAAGFYLLLRKWHTRRIALMTSLLFVTSSWFLYSARLASPASAYLLTPWLLYFGVRLQENNLRFLGLGGILGAGTLLLYIPGLCWLIIPALIWQRRQVLKELAQAGPVQAGLLLSACVIALVPLVLTFIKDPSLVADWLGLTGESVSILEFLKNVVGVPVQLYVRSDYDPASHMGRLPYLDIATTILVALGAYRYIFRRRLDRTKLLAGGLVIGTILAALNWQAAIVLLPFVYLLVAAGLTFLLQQWFTVFPRNPLARSIGVGLVCLVLGLTVFYHTRRYFVAWPSTPETRQAYSLPPLQE